MKIKTIILILGILTIVSGCCIFRSNHSRIWFTSFNDANSRMTYDFYHNIKQAQQLATGKGIKVGIVGTYFGFESNKELYAGGKDFTGDKKAFEEIAEHGLWMATTLREIAPDVEIFALNARDNNRDKETKAIIKAIDWAIENGINILTYSAEPFRPDDREDIDRAVLKAIDNNIVTTFIHYDLPENILPYGFFPEKPKFYSRKADVNIFHYDYNVLLLFNYENFLNSGKKMKNNGSDPYFSFSSMSPVLAGIIAMMKEVNNNLTVEEYKKILIKTSKTIEYNGNQIDHVVDAYTAIKKLSE